MAVPPIQRSPKAAAAGPTSEVRFPWLLDAVLGLLIVAALPLAIVAIPNTVSIVADLLPSDIDRIGLMRAHGLALPAMLLAVPLAAVALRRMKVAHVLVGGLALLAVADAAGGYAGSAFLVGVLRVLHGVGAGLLVPATLVAAWERPRWVRALWTGMLALSLVSAQALALWPLAGVRSWRITLQPYPMLTGIALALAAGYFLLWLVRGEQATPKPRAKEGNRLLLAAVPAAVIAFVAISTAQENWDSGLVVIVAGLAIAAMLALASIGSTEGRTWAYVMVAIGTVVLPTVAQVTYVEMGGLGGPGLKGLWLPFTIAGVGAVAGALLTRLVSGAKSKWLTPGGLLAVVVGLSCVRLLVPAADGFVLVVPFTLLAVGAAVAMTAALRGAGLGGALFGLALCFPGVLAGYLLGTGIQVMVLSGAQSAQAVVDGFVDALHWWALIGGFLVVAIIVLAALVARRTAVAAGIPGPRVAVSKPVTDTEDDPDEAAIMAALRARAGRDAQAVEADFTDEPDVPDVVAPSDDPEPASASDAAGEAAPEPVIPAPRQDDGAPAAAEEPQPPAGQQDDDEDHPTGEIPRIGPRARSNGSTGADPGGQLPAVPPPTQSPEDDAGS